MLINKKYLVIFKDKNNDIKVLSNNDKLFKEILKFKNIIIYMYGSTTFSMDKFKDKSIVDSLLFDKNNCILIPIFDYKNRPSYKNPDSLSNYKKVLDLRLFELNTTTDMLVDEYDESFTLFGNSEGGVPVLLFEKHSSYLRGKIIVSYSCESNYYYSLDNKDLHHNKDIPLLNILGLDDEYFGLDSFLNKNSSVLGNSSKTFKLFNYSKIVLLSNTKHSLFENNMVFFEIKNFLDYLNMINN